MRGRRWPVWLLAIGLLAGCQGGLWGDNRQQRFLNYENSLRQEADWLWNNMNYARTHSTIEGDICAPRTFEHQPVTLSDSERQASPRDASLADHLNYAAALIGQAHDEWTLYCQSARGSGGTASFIESRLLPAYNSLNQVRLACLPKQPTPPPGSG